MPLDFGPYRTTATLGEGGMGVVYRARHRETGLEVAVKAARPGPGRSDALRAEARALARVRDAGVIRILAHGSEDGAPWYAMELLDGGTMQGRLRAHWGGADLAPGSASTFDASDDPLGTLDDARAAAQAPAATRSTTRRPAANGHLPAVLDLFHALCHALAALHANGIVHRDLKPGNVFLRADGTPVVADLGLVSRYRGAFGREVFEVHGNVAGTPHYMAPEQARGLPVDARADLYSLGAMLFEALVGHPPFDSGSALPVLQRILHDPAVAPSTFVDGVPAALDRLVLRLLEKEPRRRFGYAEDVASVLVEVGARAEDRPFPQRTYLYRPGIAGRREPLELLRGWVDAARTGKGGMVLLHGESGVGKTTLAATAAARARTHAFAVLGGECLPEQASADTRLDVGGAPLHPLRGFLLSLGDACRSDTMAPFRAQVAPALLVLAPFEPSLGSLPEVEGLSTPAAAPPELAHARVQDALRSALAWWMARRGPTLLVIDDLQWVDELTGAFLLGLDADWLQAHPLLVLGTMRTAEGGESVRRLRARADARHVTLGRLDPESVEAMVSDMLAWDHPSPRLVGELYRMSEGNPFFVAEYLRLAAAEGILVRRGGSWQLAEDSAGGRLPEPSSVAELVNARLHGLDTTALALLEAAAVLGRVFPMDKLAGVAGVAEEVAEAALSEIGARQIVEPVGVEEWRFAHDRLRESVYGALAPDRRRALHAAAARAFEADPQASNLVAVGRHWREAGETARAVDTLERAGADALARFANLDALAVFREALHLSESLPEKPGPLRLARWERALAEASLGAGDLRGGIRHVEAALVRFGQPPLPGSTLRQGLGMVVEVVRRIAQSWFPAAFRETDPVRIANTSEAAYLYNRLLEPALLDGQVALALFCGLKNLNLADRVDPAVPMVRGYGMMAAVLCVTPLKRLANRWADVGAEVGARLGAPSAHSYALQRGAVTYLVIGEYAVARERLREAVAVARGITDVRNADESNLALALIELHQGRLADAASLLTEIHQHSSERSDPQGRAMSRSLLVLVLDLLADDDAIQPLAAELGADLDRLSDTDAMLAHAARAAARLRAGDTAGARAATEEVLRLCRKAPPLTYVLSPALDATAAVLGALRERAARDGTPDAAPLTVSHREACTILERFAGASPHVTALARIRRGLDHHLSGRPGKAEAAWRQALTAGRALDQWHATGLAAAELVIRVRPADAQTLTVTARTDLLRAGARAELARLER